MTFKVNPEKSIKKLPQILLNDEFENYAKTFGKNYNNIENLLASKSLNELKSNHLTNSQVYLTHPNTSNTNSSTLIAHIIILYIRHITLIKFSIKY